MIKINLFVNDSSENFVVVKIFLAVTLLTPQGTSGFRETHFSKRLSKGGFKLIMIFLLRTGTQKRRVLFWGLIQPL